MRSYIPCILIAALFEKPNQVSPVYRPKRKVSCLRLFRVNGYDFDIIRDHEAGEHADPEAADGRKRRIALHKVWILIARGTNTEKVLLYDRLRHARSIVLDTQYTLCRVPLYSYFSSSGWVVPIGVYQSL